MPLAVDLDRLRSLLAMGAESDDLDFKATWNPDEKSDLVELCKDIAAMEALPAGGYVVIGATDSGTPSDRFSGEPASSFDEQRIRGKLAKLLDEPIDFSAALHRLDGHPFLIIGVGTHRHGMRIMSRDGGYEKQGQAKTVWRVGDVFVRRGTSSVRWNQHEALGIIDRVVAARKEEWRKDILDTLRATTPVFQPDGLVNVNVEMPAEAFSTTVLELIRRGDEVGLDVLLRKTVSRAVSLVADAAGQDARATAAELSSQLDRLDVIVVLSSRYSAQATLGRAMEGYREIYEAVDEDVSYPHRFPLGHKEILVHLYAVGAILARGKDWEGLSLLVRLPPVSTSNGYWKTLLRKAEVMTARSGLPEGHDGERSGVIEAAKPTAARLLDHLGDPQPPDLTDPLVHFDVYRGIANGGRSDSGKLGAYTNFALYYAARAEPAFLAVLDDPQARAALFDGSDAELSAVYRHMSKAAINEAFAFNGWDGFEDPRLIRFAESAPG